MRKFERATEAIDQWRTQVEARSPIVNHKRATLGSSVKVWPLVRPEIDARKIARALVQLTRHKQGKDDVSD